MNNKGILLHPNDHKKEKDWMGIFNFLDRNIKYEKISKSLDLGSGRGDVSYHILRKNPNNESVCVDVDLVLLEEAGKRHKNIKILQHDINEKLPFEDNSMDLVSCLGTLHYPYIIDPEKVFSEMARVSKKYIIVDFLYKFGIWHFLLKIRHPEHNPRRYADKKIKEIFKKHNFKIIGKFGTKFPFGDIFPSFGRITVFILEKQNE